MISQVSQTIMDSAESVKTQVIEKGNEMKKTAEEVAAPYVDQALVMKKSAEETLDNSILKPVKSVQENINGTFIEPANQLRERITPTIKAAHEGCIAAPEAAKQFIEARMEESSVDRHSADVVELSKALALAIYAWSKVEAAKLYHYCLTMITASAFYVQIQDQVAQSKSRVDTAVYAENSMGFYFQWAMLVAYSLWELALTYVPNEYSQRIETTFNDAREMVSPYQEKASVMVDDIYARAEEPLKMVQEYGEPIKCAIIERGATVEALVKQSVLGDIFERGMKSLNTEKPKTEVKASEGKPTDVSESKEASVAPVVVAAE